MSIDYDIKQIYMQQKVDQIIDRFRDKLIDLRQEMVKVVEDLRKKKLPARDVENIILVLDGFVKLNIHQLGLASFQDVPHNLQTDLASSLKEVVQSFINDGG